MNRTAPHSCLVTDILLALGQEPDLTLWRMSPMTPPGPDGRPLHAGPVGMADLCGILARTIKDNNGKIVAHVGEWFCLEVKTGEAKQRPRQILWGHLIQKRSGFYSVVRSVDDARAALARARMGTTS